MGSVRPVDRGRIPLAAALPIVLALAACARRPPLLVPPSGGVEAVEGFGSASIEGVEASIKGKFGFVFRRPGLGRVEGLDPIGRTAFLILFRADRAWFVLPGRRVYAEDEAGVMMARFLGGALLPDEAIRLLSGTWEAGAKAEGESGWNVDRDIGGRVVRGVRGGFSFTVRGFFPGDGVPREIGLEGPGTSGRMKVLKLGFNPPPREEAFDAAFLRAYAPKTWEEILELLDR
ncbi:MAG: hypothetical protein WCC00_05540 [Candidatus Aminicenantales bacterium]